MKQSVPKLKYSLLGLFLMILVASIPFAYYANQRSALKKHHNAIRRVKSMGGHVTLMTASGRITAENNPELFRNAGAPTPSTSVANEASGGNEGFADIMMSRPSILLAEVDFTDPALTKQKVRTMVAELQKIVLSSKTKEYGGGFINVSGNGIFTPEFVAEIGEKLPDFSFMPTATPFPNATAHSIEIGMTAGQVSKHVAQRMYDERTDWVGDPAPILRNLASCRHEYKNTDGSTTWTYATDDIGVGAIVIDFDDQSCVSNVSFSQGTPRRLRGKRIRQQPQDGMFMN